MNRVLNAILMVVVVMVMTLGIYACGKRPEETTSLLGGHITVSGPDKYGVVCYTAFQGVSCVKVTQ